MKNNQNLIEISDLPYSERQLIVIQPDDVVNKTRAAKNNESDDWKSKFIKYGNIIYPFGIYGYIAMQAYEIWSKARASGLKILAIKSSEAHEQLNLPPGHPKNGILYICHPAIPNSYYNAASFHRMVFEHKFSEAVDLLMKLGATYIEVEHIQGWGQEFSATLSVPISSISADASMHLVIHKSPR